MLILPLILTALLLLVCFYDATHYRIPNWICGLLLALYLAMLLLSPALPESYSILWSLGVFALVFVVGVVVFALRWAGGGDVKLLAVLSLWTGREATLELVVCMALLGGLMTLALMVLRIALLRLRGVERTRAMPEIFHIGKPFPYGLAIALGFLLLLWTGMVPGVAV